MLRLILAATMVALASVSVSAKELTNAEFIHKYKKTIAVCLERDGSNFQGRYNLCSRSKGTGLGYWVALTDTKTGKVLQLPDAELGVTVARYGTKEFPKEFIVYNPDFSSILAWSDELPARIFVEYYSYSPATGLVLEIKTKNPFTQ